MNIIFSIFRLRFTKHLAFWVFILFFHISRSNFNFVHYTWQAFYAELAEHALMLPVLIAASYFTAYVLIPKYLIKKKYLRFILLLILSAVFFILAMRIILYFIILPSFYPSLLQKYPDFTQFNIFQHLFYIYSTVAILVMLKISGEWHQALEQKNQLQQQNLMSELALLRTQVNPHFLFNTLNNINALIKKDPEKTSLSVIKLSEIMRYMLYDASKEKVLLKKEIEYIESLIGLQQLRLNEPGFIMFEVNGNPANIQIAPMLFVPFVENAFKHANKDVTSPGIKIQLTINPENLHFSITNSKRITSDPMPDNYNGIGIPNVKRRLELLYPNKHQLHITDNNQYFKISLHLLLI